MTKSSRKMDRIAGRPKWTSSKYKCEECGGSLIKFSANRYACISCGLIEQIKY